MLLSQIPLRKIRISIPPELFDLVNEIKRKDDDSITIEQRVTVVRQIKAKVITSDFNVVWMLFTIGFTFVLSETTVG